MNSPRDYLLQFFRELDKLLPPPPNCHHAIMRMHYGADVRVWQEKIGVSVRVPTKDGTDTEQLTYFLDEMDFAKAPADLASEILGLVQNDLDPL